MLAVVTSHYNFSGFSAPRRNLHRFLRQMGRDGIPVYGTELFLKGQQPQTKGVPGWRQHRVTSAAILWQKERLVNLAVERLPREFEFVAEVDADLWFDRPRWAEGVVEMLESHPLGQPFERAVWTGPEGEAETERQSAAKAGFRMEPWLGHTGFSWAFRRDFFEAVGGFFDLALLGGGDLLWSSAALNETVDYAGLVKRTGLGSDACFRPWVENFKHALGGDRPGHVAGSVWHEYHGSRKNRRYNERAEILRDFDPLSDVERHPNGWLQWSATADRGMMQRVANYFAGRREDG